MNSMTKRILFALLIFQMMLLTTFADQLLGTLRVSPYTVSIPPYNGTWYLCNDRFSTYASYSVKLSSNSAIKNNSYGETTDGFAAEPSNSFESTGFTAWLAEANTREGIAQHKDALYIPLLSCMNSLNSICQNDSGKTNLASSKYCLVVVNPTSSQQKVQVALSFTKSVFQENVESPDPDNTSNMGVSTRMYLIILFVGSVLLVLVARICIHRRKLRRHRDIESGIPASNPPPPYTTQGDTAPPISLPEAALLPNSVPNVSPVPPYPSKNDSPPPYTKERPDPIIT